MNLAHLATGLAVVALTAGHPVAAQHEIMLGRKTAASNPSVSILTWSTEPPLPSAAIDALAGLQDAVETLGLADVAILTSESGLRVAAMQAWRGADSAVPLGVTIWPDWRRADATVTIADMSRARFLSNNHVLLSHHPDGGPYVSVVVDIRRPATRFQFTGFQLGTLRVTDEGRWAALAGDGSLSMGELDPAAGPGSVTGVAVPIGGAVRNLQWTADGAFLLVERHGPVIEVLRPNDWPNDGPDDWASVSSIIGGLGPNSGSASPAGRNAWFGYQPDVGECVFTVLESGRILAARWAHQDAGETGLFVSPSGKFVITQKGDALGFVRRHCRKSPAATTEDAVPTWPDVPQGTRIQDIGWLLWTP